MHKRLVLLLLSFAMLACSGASVGMQGKGFDEFPKLESVSIDEIGVEYAFQLQQCNDITRSRSGMSAANCPDGAVIVDIGRLAAWTQDKYAKSYYEALSAAGFEAVNDSDDKVVGKRSHSVDRGSYIKVLGETLYSARIVSNEHSDSYGYLIEKPKIDLLEYVNSLSKWPSGEVMGTRLIQLATKAVFADEMTAAMEQGFVDMEIVLEDLAKAGFLEDSSILEDAKHGWLMGGLIFSPNGDFMVLRIISK